MTAHDEHFAFFLHILSALDEAQVPFLKKSLRCLWSDLVSLNPLPW